MLLYIRTETLIKCTLYIKNLEYTFFLMIRLKTNCEIHKD